MVSSCAEKRTLATPLNDLTPQPSAEMLRALKLQDCAQKYAAIKKALSPIDLIFLVNACPTAEMSAALEKLKEFVLEKNLERVYIVESGKSDIGFDIEGVRSLKLSLAGVNDSLSLEQVWKSHERELNKNVEKVMDNRIPLIFIEDIVTQSHREIKKLNSLLKDLNENEDFIRTIEEKRLIEGQFPIFLSQDKCVSTNSALYLMIKPSGFLGSIRGALKKCLKSASP